MRNKEQRKRDRQWNRDKIKELIRMFKDQPCTDCGIKYPYYIMEFDHLSDKKFKFGRPGGKSQTQIIEEILKCEVVCSNCHKIRTYVRMKREVE